MFMIFISVFIISDSRIKTGLQGIHQTMAEALKAHYQLINTPTSHPGYPGTDSLSQHAEKCDEDSNEQGNPAGGVTTL